MSFRSTPERGCVATASGTGVIENTGKGAVTVSYKGEKIGEIAGSNPRLSPNGYYVFVTSKDGGTAIYEAKTLRRLRLDERLKESEYAKPH